MLKFHLIVESLKPHKYSFLLLKMKVDIESEKITGITTADLKLDFPKA
jgi:hypothetical protein